MGGLGDALMEVMRGTAVTFSTILTLIPILLQHYLLLTLLNTTVLTSTVSCQHGTFRCSNGQCVSSSFRCDGRTGGCSDGSDERNCSRFLNHLTVDTFCSIIAVGSCNSTLLVIFVQISVKLEHFYAAMVSVSSPLAAVMGIKIVLMTVMRPNVVATKTETVTAIVAATVAVTMAVSMHV